MHAGFEHINGRRVVLKTAQDASGLASGDKFRRGQYLRKVVAVGFNACDFGLLLVSPSFLASDYIVRKELPHFLPISDAARPQMRQRRIRLLVVSTARSRFMGAVGHRSDA